MFKNKRVTNTNLTDITDNSSSVQSESSVFKKYKNMKCVVIAAGYATRLGELTKNFPKPLLKIGENTVRMDWRKNA